MAVDYWTREQTIVALRAYFIVPFNRASNKQEDIVRTASIIGRKPSSVKMKIGNFGSLDPELAKHGIVGLSGTTALDKSVWNEFAHNREKLATESEQLINDFFKAPNDDLKKEEALLPTGEDVMRLAKTRTYQNFFRESVVGIYDKRCCITGLRMQELLIASHIIPWSKDKVNRLNPENGLCLNPLHDKAFDRGLLTVTPDYKVRLSKRLLSEINKGDASNYFKAYDDKLILLPERHHPNKEFLDFHNQHVFEK